MAKGGIFTSVSRSIFNVYFKATQTRKYYGSLKALFDDNDQDAIGTSLHMLYRRTDKDWVHPFDNDKVCVEKGELITTGDVKKQ